MPSKVLKKILEEFKQKDDEFLSIVDQGVTDILEIPELSNNNNNNKNLIINHYSLKFNYFINSFPEQIDKAYFGS